MTAVAVCLIVGIINLVLWAVLFLHFKSRYSSEKILSDIADELNKLVRDVNNETVRCVTLVEEGREGLLRLIDEAKRYVDLGHESLVRKAQSMQVMDALNNEAPLPKPRRTSYADLAPGSRHSRSPIQQGVFDKAPVDALVDLEDGYRMEVSVGAAMDLVSDEAQGKVSQVHDGIGVREIKVPEINISEIRLPEITKAQKQVLAEKSLRARVLELHAEGFGLDAIASRLDRSVAEVQLIVELHGPRA